jgi:predicted nucleic acid-binding protein
VTSGFLLDTNVVAVTAPDRRPVALPEKLAARAWIVANQPFVFLPATAVAEVAAGIGWKEAGGATRYASRLAAWLTAVLDAYPDRVLAFDAEAALHARVLTARSRQAGIEPGFADLTIACIARAHGLAVATRNLRHFLPMGVPAVDPFAG